MRVRMKISSAMTNRIAITLASGLAPLGLAAMASGSTVGGISILLGAIVLKALIVSPFLLLRPFADRMRRFLSPWLPW